jgi:hypothetical protein
MFTKLVCLLTSKLSSIPASRAGMTRLWMLSQHPFSCHPSSWHWDPGYYFSNKYLRNLPSKKQGKRSPSQYLFSVLAFLCLKRCNLAAFKRN